MTKFTGIQKFTLTLTLLFCIGYCWSYVHFRQNHAIVHSSSCDGDSVEARLPDGPHLFAASILSNESSDTLLEQHLRRVDLLNAFYFPLRKLEEIYWSFEFEWI